ncbi:MAG: polysaccharide biosynthesis tyrosine autokinase [Candidatus Omnitrophica bacterium]|nr:polysaccharide biosynthesis tyrosine autokinase [Candidatus Omnitrophota bacterium]
MADYVKEAHLSDYLKIIKRRKNVLLIFFLVTVTVVTTGSFLMQPVYRATATILVDLESPNVLTASGSVALENSNYYTYKEYFQSQKEIVRSRSIAKEVFEEFDLGRIDKYSKTKDPIDKFLKDIRVETVRDTRLFLLQVDNEDPKLAAEMANRIAELYVARNLAYIAKSEVINLLKNEYLKLQARLSEYSKVYKHMHPKMIRLNQEIEQVAQRIKQEKERVAGYDVADASFVEVNNGNLISDLTGLKANNISIQDRAEAPVLPIKPKKRLNIVLAILVGFFGGTGMAFFFEYLDDTVKGLEDVEKIADWPFLGNMPLIDEKKRMDDAQKDLFAHKQPDDPITENYRAIRTGILFSSTEEHHLKSIVITSAGPQEGKTTTLCNLGIAMAQSKNKVLLVDADMRKPRLHEIFKISNKIGLSNFLSEQAGFEEVIQKPEIKNLSLVSGGPHPPNPSELLSSHKMAEFINTAKENFDFVIFDSPPIAVVTDACILSRAVDGVVLVIEVEKTSRRALPRVEQLLKKARARVVGTLFNKVKLSRGQEYNYYHYYYASKK